MNLMFAMFSKEVSRRAANRLRITGQLVDTEAGRHIWASKFDGDLDDVFSLARSSHRAVVHAIEPSIRMAEIERARSKRTSNLTAYDLYLRSIPEKDRLEAAGLRRAKALLEAGLVIDPHFAEAWSALADCYGRLVIGGWEDKERGLQEALNAARRGVEADPRMAPCSRSLPGHTRFPVNPWTSRLLMQKRRSTFIPTRRCHRPLRPRSHICR